MPRHDNGPVREHIVQYLTDYIARNGFAPTNVELAAEVGRTKQSLGMHLRALHREGRITRGPGSRALGIPTSKESHDQSLPS